MSDRYGRTGLVSAAGASGSWRFRLGLSASEIALIQPWMVYAAARQRWDVRHITRDKVTALAEHVARDIIDILHDRPVDPDTETARVCGVNASTVLSMRRRIVEALRVMALEYGAELSRTGGRARGGPACGPQCGPDSGPESGLVLDPVDAAASLVDGGFAGGVDGGVDGVGVVGDG
jgi:hypothetical protein